MISPLTTAVHGIHRSFKAAIVLVAAALLLPLVAGAKSMQELPAGHWAYAAIARVTSVGVFQQLQEIDFDTAHTRTRYELAMLISKATAALDAAALATPARELPVAIRVSLRAQGLQRQLAALEEVYTAFSQLSSPSDAAQKAYDVMTAKLPALRADVAAIAQKVQQAQQLAEQEKKIDAILGQIQATRLQVANLAPDVYKAAWAYAAPTTVSALADSITASRGGENAHAIAAKTLEELAALQREFALELKTLNPIQGATMNPVLTGFVPASNQAIPHTVLDAPWPVEQQVETEHNWQAKVSAPLPTRASEQPRLNQVAHTTYAASPAANADAQKNSADYRFDLGAASVSARVELVDIDRLRHLTVETGNYQDKGNEQSGKQAKLGVDGSVRLGESGSIGIGFNLNANSQGTKATTNFDVGYSISRNSSLSARYELINFAESASADNANIAQAKLTVLF